MLIDRRVLIYCGRSYGMKSYRTVKMNKTHEYLILKLNCSYRSKGKKVPENYIQYNIFSNKPKESKTKQYIPAFMNILGDLKQRNKRHNIQGCAKLCSQEVKQGDVMDRNVTGNILLLGLAGLWRFIIVLIQMTTCKYYVI